MPFACTFKQRHGKQFCVTDCPASAPCGIFEYVRVERPEDVPPAGPARDRRRRPGHEPRLAQPRARLAGPRGHGRELRGDRGARGRRAAGAGPLLRRAPLGRAAGGAPGGRFSLYVGTGGPGHIDPRPQRRGRHGGPGRAGEPGLGGAGLPAVRRDPGQRGRGAPRGVPHLRHPVPVVRSGASPCCGARRRASAPASSRTCSPAGPGAPLVPSLRRAARERAAGCASWRTVSSTSSRRRTGPAWAVRHRLGDARGRRPAGRRGDHGGVRPRPRAVSCRGCSRSTTTPRSWIDSGR